MTRVLVSIETAVDWNDQLRIHTYIIMCGLRIYVTLRYLGTGPVHFLSSYLYLFERIIVYVAWHVSFGSECERAN